MHGRFYRRANPLQAPVGKLVIVQQPAFGGREGFLLVYAGDQAHFPAKGLGGFAPRPRGHRRSYLYVKRNDPVILQPSNVALLAEPCDKHAGTENPASRFASFHLASGMVGLRRFTGILFHIGGVTAEKE